MSRNEADPRFEGLVAIDPEEVVHLVHLKRARLHKAEAAAHEAKIKRIIEWNSRPRRYFWRPWKFKPITITRERAEEIYASHDDWGYSRRQWLASAYAEQHEKCNALEDLAREADRTMHLSLRTLSWLKGLFDEDA